MQIVLVAGSYFNLIRKLINFKACCGKVCYAFVILSKDSFISPPFFGGLLFLVALRRQFDYIKVNN